MFYLTVLLHLVPMPCASNMPILDLDRFPYHPIRLYPITLHKSPVPSLTPSTLLTTPRIQHAPPLPQSIIPKPSTALPRHSTYTPRRIQ